MTEELVKREIRIDKATGRCDSDLQIMSLDVIMQLKPLSTMRALIVRCFALFRLVMAGMSLNMPTSPIWR